MKEAPSWDREAVALVVCAPGRSFPWPRLSVSLGFLHVVYLPGWERVWNRGPRVGKDQGLLLVACHGGVLEGHLQAPGHVRDAVGPVVWRRQVLRGESRVRRALVRLPTRNAFCLFLLSCRPVTCFFQMGEAMFDSVYLGGMTNFPLLICLNRPTRGIFWCSKLSLLLQEMELESGHLGFFLWDKKGRVVSI